MLAVREPAIAGTWYPDEPEALVAEVESYLGAAPERALDGRLLALISPHAGLVYSGPVAAHGYRLLRGWRDATVVLIGPSHRAAFRGVAVCARGSWRTPLGSVAIDEAFAAALIEQDARDGGQIFEDPRVHRSEHAIEIQLPFLAHLIPGLRIVPVMMGSQSRAEVDALAGALARVAAGRPSLLVASSDLSHYHPAREAHELDGKVLALVERYDVDGLMALIEETGEHACGGGPIVAVMKAARSLGADRAVTLRYADSGDEGARDKERVVGYLSAALIAGDS